MLSTLASEAHRPPWLEPKRWVIACTMLLMTSLNPASAAEFPWVVQPSGTRVRLRGLSVVSGKFVWASGIGGTFIRTIDGGKSWQARTVAGASSLDFRDVEAFNSDVAYLLSIGAGEQSRILKTTTGGASWSTLYVNKDPKGFLDALAFWDTEHGLALGDPVDGRFVILRTDDGGTTWNSTAPDGMPYARPGEGAFAASGTCLVVHGETNAWFGTGGARVSRVFRSTDRGRTWTVQETPVMAGTPSSGIFSLSFQDADHGIAVGGDYKEPAKAGNLVALTEDGGRSWRPPKGSGLTGYRSAVAYVPSRQGRTLVAVGPTGSDISLDGGENWQPFGTEGFNAVGFSSLTAGWAVGENGTIAKFPNAPQSSE